MRPIASCVCGRFRITRRGAEYLIGRCLEMSGKDEAAFNAYEAIINKYPHSESYEDVLWRQYEIANRFLGGEFFRLWGTIPLYRSMDETASCSAPSSPTGLSATSRRMRNCASVRRARSRRITPMR